jgi:hypothetical protein
MGSDDVRDAFTAVTENTVGLHGFIHFFKVYHGAWTGTIFDTPTAKVLDWRNLKFKRFILGNPLIAIGMMKCDLGMGLYVPTELFLVEGDDGESRIAYHLLGGLVADW